MNIEKELEIIKMLQSKNKTTDKMKILRDNKDNDNLKRILEYCYNPYKKYKISEKKLIELLEETLLNDNSEDKDIEEGFKLLDDLANNNINDNLRDRVKTYLNNNNLREFWFMMITKNLNIGVNRTSLNKIWEGLIPTSNGGVDIKCMLGSKLDLKNLPKGIMYVTEKLDGSRCLAIIKDGNIELYSRQGQLIEGCNEIIEGIKQLELNNVVLDGEITAKDVDISEVYKETMKRLKNKKADKVGLQYNIFDIVTLKEFEDKKGVAKYSERREVLNRLKDNEHIHILPLLTITEDFDKVMEIHGEMKEKGAEGCMINLNKPYEFKRSKTLIKVKVMLTCDLRIIGFEQGQGENKGILGAIICEYKNTTLKCGSGFSKKLRKVIWDNPRGYLGKIVEIQYFEETYSEATGLPSLRFPVFKQFRDDKTEPSYD